MHDINNSMRSGIARTHRLGIKSLSQKFNDILVRKRGMNVNLVFDSGLSLSIWYDKWIYINI